MDHRIVFVAGALRSGTTLFRLILNNHPWIINPGEFDFVFDRMADDGEFPDIDHYKDWLSTHRIFLSHNLKIDPDLGYDALISSILAQKAQADSLLSVNVHRGFHKIPFLFPDARYIHLLRDPRDVALSCISMGWAGNVYFGANGWIETEISWDRLKKGVDESRIFELKFEDLVSAPRRALCDVCQFLNVDFDQTMLEYCKSSTYDSINTKSLNRWKTRLKPNELATLEHKAYGLLLRRGYALSGVQTRGPSLLELAVLRARNKLHVWRFAIRRYGLLHFVMEKIARIFRLARLRKQLQLRANKVDVRYLK